MGSDVARPSGDLGDAAIMAGLEAAQAACRARGLRFTDVRRAVLETLMRTGQPAGAYEIIGRLEALLGRRLPPQSVYRALDFLLGQHLVARIESKNAFIACANPHHPHACVFLLCEHCGTSRELENVQLEQLVGHAAATLGFRVAKPVVELQGTCSDCQNQRQGQR